MLKNIIIGVLSLITITSLLFASIKASDAQKQKNEAERAMTLAFKNAEEAKAQEHLALDAAEQATRAIAEAEAAKASLRQCQEGK